MAQRKRKEASPESAPPVRGTAARPMDVSDDGDEIDEEDMEDEPENGMVAVVSPWKRDNPAAEKKSKTVLKERV
jgi:hypothetical protein